MKKTIFIFFLFAVSLFCLAGKGAVQVQLDKDKTFQNAFALISESDLYCSFFLLEDMPDLKITASEKPGEKMIFADGDLVYIQNTESARLKEGQSMMVLEIGPTVTCPSTKKSLGPVAFRRGRVRIVRFEKKLAIARVEKACGQVMVGDFLVPFVEKEGLLGKDLGFDVPARGEEPLSGQILFLDNEFVQVGPGQWALIDLGKNNGIHVGQQLTIFHQAGKDLPLESVANVIVVDAGRLASTVKVLSAKDAVRLGDIVQMK